jgi:hypothetical protein
VTWRVERMERRERRRVSDSVKTRGKEMRKAKVSCGCGNERTQRWLREKKNRLDRECI